MRKRRLLSSLVVFVILISLLCPIIVYASSITDWNTVCIDQSGVGHGSGCTVVSLQLLLQNSQTLKEEYQLEGRIATKVDEKYNAFDAASRGFVINGTNDSWSVSDFVNTANTLCDATWSSFRQDDDGNAATSIGYGNIQAVVGLNGHDFKDMSYDEQLAAMALFWNSGYFTIFCVDYEGVAQDSNGPKTDDNRYMAAHVTMLAGIDGDTIYLNDPAGGRIKSYAECTGKGGAYKLLYVLLFKNDKTSPVELSGGMVDASLLKKAAKGLGLDTGVITDGIQDESQFASFLVLAETNIEELLDEALRSDLTQEEREGLVNWERNAISGESEHGIIHWWRMAVMIVGILFIVWSLALYLAFWFDRLNTIVDIDLLGVLTLGQLHVAFSDEESTYGVTKLDRTEKKLLNHRDIIKVCLMGLIFGFLLVSGLYYRLLRVFVNFVLRFIYGR